MKLLSQGMRIESVGCAFAEASGRRAETNGGSIMKLFTSKSSLPSIAAACCLLSAAAGATDRWAKTIGGTDYESLSMIQRTSDNGYIVVGDTHTFAAGGSSDSDGWIVKLTSAGAVEWQRTCGGSLGDWFLSAKECADGGFIAVGSTKSFGGGQYDVFVVRFDAYGNIIWQFAYGGSQSDEGVSVLQTADGGFLVAGDRGLDMLLMKLDGWGSVLWQKTYATGSSTNVSGIARTSDGGAIVVGGTYILPDQDGVLLKVDASGTVIWANRYGGSSADWLFAVTEAAGGGSYIAAGQTNSGGLGGKDGWALKVVPSTGTPILSVPFGGSGDDSAFGVEMTADNGFVFAGSSTSSGGGAADAWLVKLQGDLLGLSWVTTYGGSDNEYASSVCLASDGDPVFAGSSKSLGPGVQDGFLVKAAQFGALDPACTIARSGVGNVGSSLGSWSALSVVTSSSSFATYPVSSIITAPLAQLRTYCAATGPTISSIKSKTSKPGSAATIYGTGFSTTSKKNTVYFGTQKAKVSKAKTTSLKVKIPKKVSKGTVGVYVVLDGVTSNTFPFDVK